MNQKGRESAAPERAPFPLLKLFESGVWRVYDHFKDVFKGPEGNI